MDEFSNLQTIDGEEEIARIIFSPSMVVGGNVAPSAFFLVKLRGDKPEGYLSVWRLALKVPNRENVKFPPRIQGDTLYGYAELNVCDCHNAAVGECRCAVKVNLKSPNQYHAGIYYTKGNERIVGECYDPAFVLFASVLAGQSVLVKI